MVRATLYVTIKPGREDEFVEVWKGISQQVRTARGNLGQTLLRDPDDPRSFVVTSDWESRGAFTEFERSPEQDELTAPVRDLRETGRMTVHDLLIHVEGGKAE
jgi:heme-degrading monooxygenase HmoA